MKHVVVTGASTGIGEAIARDLAGAGHHVFGTVRREEDGQRLSAELKAAFTALLLDVTDAEAIGRAASRVEEELGDGRLAGLVNNAGIAVAGPLPRLPLSEFRKQFEVNVIGLLAVTQAFLPMLARRSPEGAPGRVVNISSISGVRPVPMLGAYGASKAAVEALSRVLRSELLPQGVQVAIIEPGNIDTPIWKKTQSVFVEGEPVDSPLVRRALANFDQASRSAMPASVVVGAVRESLFSPRPRQRYVVTRNPWVRRALLSLPAHWLDRILAGRFGLTR